MNGLTNPFANGPWSLEDKPTITATEEDFPTFITANLRDKEWDQYCDPDVYDCDKRLREWAAKSRAEIPNWDHIHKYRKFAMYQMFEILYGRPYDGQKDTHFGHMMKNIMNYYASSMTKCVYDSKTKQWKRRPCYTLSPKRLFDKPYSLKLRFEWLVEQGKTPTMRNMKLPEADLKPGHARSKKTEVNKQRRAEKSRQAYLEYQKKYREEHKAKNNDEQES